MARRLILLTFVMWCAGCATAPAPHAKAPSSSPPQVSREDAAKAAQQEVDSVLPPAPPQLGDHGAERPKEHLAQTDESQQQAQVADWFTHLSQGNIQYKIADTMFWKEASTVSVVIQGPEAPASSGLENPTETAPLKISNRMQVKLSSPDNPDEFTITPEAGTTDVQFVPTNGSTTWSWSVTPKYTGSSQRLQVSAWVLYPGEGDQILLRLPVYTSSVNVHVPGFGEAMKRLIEGDPDYWLKYGLPGGGGFVFVAGVIGWFFKRKSGKKEKQP